MEEIIKIIMENVGNRRVFIWGACKSGELFKKILMEKKIEIAGFIDKKADMFKIASEKVISPNKIINNSENIYVVVAVVNYYREIEEFLIKNRYKLEKDYYYIYRPQIVNSVFNQKDNSGNEIEGSLLNTKVEFGGYNNKIIIGENIDVKNAKLDIRFLSNNSFLEIKSGCCFDGEIHIFIHDNSKLIIQENCTFRDKTYFSVAINSEISIGKNSTFNDMFLIFSTFNGKIEIGEDCMVSLSVTIGNNDGHAIFDVKSGENINGGGMIYIGNHVWIGNKATILTESFIESGSIVAANSLLTGRKKFSNNCIIAGSPAKVIRKNIAWDRSITDSEIIKKSVYYKLTEDK